MMNMEGSNAYIIAEMSANHAGSFERAKEIIHSARASGADCIKIQTYTPDTMTIDCDNEYFRIVQGTWKGENLYQLYGKAYTPWEWQKDLKEEADRIGIDFLSTPFDRKSVDFLEDLNVAQYKIASFELVDIPLIEYIASMNKPIILSTGMGTIEEIGDAVNAIRKHHDRITLLKCSSAYPAVSEEMNLVTMLDMKERFGCPVGISDHSMGGLGAAAAVAMGASVVEKHYCLSREIENPDSSFSMEPGEFSDMVKEIRTVERARGRVQYGPMEQERDSIVFRRSLFAVEDIRAGEKLTKDNIRVIRPGYGMKPKYYADVLGKIAAQDIGRGTPLAFEMIRMEDRGTEI